MMSHKSKNIINPMISSLVHEPLKKVPIGYFSILGGTVGLGTIVLSSILYYSKQSFTFFSHWISNMGVNGPDYSNGVFKYGLMLSAIFIFFLSLSIVSQYSKKSKLTKYSSYVLLISGIISTIGIFMLTIWDMFSSENGFHSLGATLFFVSAIVFCISGSLVIYGLGYKNKNIITILIIIVYLALIPVTIYVISSGIDFTGTSLLSSMDMRLAGYRFIEWTFLYLYFAWVFQTAFVILRGKKREPKIISKE